MGNAVATVVIARWEGALDVDRLRTHLDQETDEEADNPEDVVNEEDEAHGIGTGLPGRAKVY